MRVHPMHEVLLVDPDAEMRRSLTLFLRMRNVTVESVRDPACVLDVLRRGFRPCVVLADPRVGGDRAWTLVDALRRDAMLATVPLVLLSHDPLDTRNAGWRHVRELIAKPAAPTTLLAAIIRNCRRCAHARPPSQRLESPALLRRVEISDEVAVRPARHATTRRNAPLLRRLA